MSILKEVQDFIRDANVKIGDLGLDIAEKQYHQDFSKEYKLQRELIALVDALYVSEYAIQGHFNHLDWDDLKTLKIIQHYRAKANMNEVNYAQFSNYNPVIVQVAEQLGNAVLPEGGPGYLFKSSANTYIWTRENRIVSNFNSIFNE